MSFDPITRLTSRTIVIAQENIDTDQIIPARFLTTTSREGLGEAAFYDWRYDGQGNRKPGSPLDKQNPATHQILVAGANFGCGSSREHAPWALMDYGFRAVISSDIADIFTSNALKNGLAAIEIDSDTHRLLMARPGESVTIDLEENRLVIGNHATTFTLEPFARQCLLDGTDSLGALMKHLSAIRAFEAEPQQ